MFIDANPQTISHFFQKKLFVVSALIRCCEMTRRLITFHKYKHTHGYGGSLEILFRARKDNRYILPPPSFSHKLILDIIDHVCPAKYILLLLADQLVVYVIPRAKTHTNEFLTFVIFLTSEHTYTHFS